MNRLSLENGTRLWHYINSSAPVEIVGANRDKLFSDTKNENILIAPYYQSTFYTRLLFPSAVDLTHIFFANRTVNGASWTGTMYKSSDTTDGFDGTWVTTGGVFLENNSFDTGSPQVFSHSGVKGLYWDVGNTTSAAEFLYYQMFAAYGTWANSQLIMIETTTTNRLTGQDFSYGTVQRGIVDSSTYSFRVRNTGALQANGVTVSTYMFTSDLRGDDIAGLSFSDDGGTTWHNNLSLGNLAAGNNSAVIDMKLTTFNDMPTGRYRPRIVIDAASWS